MNIARFDILEARLWRLQRNGGVSVNTGGASDWYEVMLFPPASPAEIDRANALFGGRLPEDFVQFWRFTNGANLFLNESALHGVAVASTGMLGEFLRDEMDFYGAEAMAPYAVFGGVNGAGDFLVFDLETGRVLDGIHSEQPHEWHPVAENFTEWLERFLDANGKYFWIEALYERTPG